MGKLTNDFYYCKSCKKVEANLEELLFVEEGSPHCFCSETCIEDFYSPLVDYFTKIIGQLRSDLRINEPDADALIEDSSVIEKLLSKPDEIWRLENDLKEELFSFISHVKKGEKKYSVIALCFLFNNTPSFVFALTASSNEFFIQNFQFGEQVENLEDYQNQQLITDAQVDPDTIEQIEHFKSKYLAGLLEERKDTDIPFESFDLYMDYLQETLENSDDIYEKQDDGEIFRTHFKAFEKNGVSFYYIAICMLFDTNENTEMILPIISFPTVDGVLSDVYREGKQIVGGLKS